jgi:hypothetical protein
MKTAIEKLIARYKRKLELIEDQITVCKGFTERTPAESVEEAEYVAEKYNNALQLKIVERDLVKRFISDLELELEQD